MRVPPLPALVAVLLLSTACSGGSPPATAGAADATATASVQAERAASPRAGTSPSPSLPPATSPSPAPTPVVAAGDGSLVVVPGQSAVSGPGEPTAYVVEVEGGLGVDPEAFAADVDRVLADPRSWGGGGRQAMQRVAAGDVGLRVALASPRTVDRLCAPLQTNGWFSCAKGDRAVLNVTRWLEGAPSYAGRLAPYRQYLVNHEVGHVLGHVHESCPAPGAPAPVMQQQTKGLDGCVHNGWPYP